MPVISIPTNFNIDVEFELPGFGRRMAALLIDMAIQAAYIVFAIKLTDIIERSNTWEYKDAHYNLWAIALLLMVPVFIYHLAFEKTTNGQSPGKKIMGLRVVNMNGGRASTSQFIIRWLLRVSDTWIVALLFVLAAAVSGAGDYKTIIVVFTGFVFLFTDVILVATTKRSQRIGDLLANTILIKTNTRESLDNTVFREVEDDYVPMFPQVMRISDKDLNVVKTILDQSRKTSHYSTARAAADKIKNYLQIQSNLEPEDFLDRLLKDYNYLSAR